MTQQHPPNIAGMPHPGMAGMHLPQRNQNGNIIVSHPALPGRAMLPPSPDYAELPAGSMSPHSPPGGITGGLSPRQSAQGAENGEYSAP